ncbi:cholesterol oxidase substrate-binding domain-containing protein [Streptomyces solicathayae]|uniref:Cholesterol oxidase substrate-binding domain-containing protein n=1 Tax=Streptomyces solicathayae TaxID=3081768 RepID=A0ABZ0LPI0_9ACTN|nr:cholesterol oxidase substrate-binding domain-containing protein [Streptomyces sp. HUAS YS2]WOX21384.1 cholesterol oxidase substrate-binding domain-containing protein [Streptomyces sp. HUAS YS2]
MNRPPRFPAGLVLYPHSFRNWSGETRVPHVWTCAPVTPQDVVTLANWAHAEGWRLRPAGKAHNWSPLVVDEDTGGEVLLVDTTQYLTRVRVHACEPDGSGSVTAETGVTVEALLSALEAAGQGLTAVPATGEPTLGGVLAVGAHGAGVPAPGEQPSPGSSFGSLSDRVLSLTAVVWNADRGGYELRVFDRTDAESGPLLTCLGRMFLTEVTLRTEPDRRLRCVSHCEARASDVFAAPAERRPGSFAELLERTGRAELLWWPFTDTTWIKSWSVTPVKPELSREVDSPYNYPFTDRLPEEASELVRKIVRGQGELTPAFCAAQSESIRAGLAATAAHDLWGWSKNLLLYLRPSALRMTTNGYAVVTARGEVQRVVSEFQSFLADLVERYRERGEYPMNGPLEIRVTGTDTAPGADPLLSPVRPDPDHPEWDVAVWLDVVTLPGTPSSGPFYREIEEWVFTTFTGDRGVVRPEWSKGWAYTDGRGPWSNARVIAETIPEAFPDWSAVCAALTSLDPHAVFDSAFVSGLLHGPSLVGARR